MKFTTVKLSDIASHPFHSMSPDDYLGDPDYVKQLLLRFNKSDEIRLGWMLDNGVITEELLRRCYAEIEGDRLNKVYKTIEKAAANMFRVLWRERRDE